MLLNRELSWLEFNKRVLMEMVDETVPLMEKLKFSSIFSSNLDEFFMIRVAAIKNQLSSGYDALDPSGLSVTEKYRLINLKVSELVKLQYDLTEKTLLQLKREGIVILDKTELQPSHIKLLATKFSSEIYPVLTPMAVDFTRRFPLIANKQIYIAVKLLIGTESKLAIVQVPSVLDRLICVESTPEKTKYVLLEDIIELFIDKLFVGHEILSTCQFRATRNGDLTIIEDEAEDLLSVIEEAVKQRKWGATVRLEISASVDQWLLKILQDALNLSTDEMNFIEGKMDLTFLSRIKTPKDASKLSRTSYKPKRFPMIDKKNIFKTIREGDVFLHHPYESFDTVIEFIKQASKDPHVLAIKQTLYRVSGDSQIIKALSDAADKGKQVTVLVELKARFDEENNIQWAKKLEQRGVHVIYGMAGLKTHSKITLVVRKEKNKIKRYIHLSTGNYNDQTSKLYTDMGLLTCKEHFGSDASIFFNMVSGYATSVNTNIMSIAPFKLRKKFIELIDREIAHVKAGHEGLIIAKMNALVDVDIVNKLYEASQAGVQIHLIIRGICVLVPGVKGLSETIKVTSVIGEFLEHSRIFYFENHRKSEVYLSSADWMTRNLNRRVELLFPVEDPVIAERIRLILKLYSLDNEKSWQLNCDGSYEKTKREPKSKKIRAQDTLKELEYTSNKEFNDKLRPIVEGK